jgi:hypothetical protein
MSSWTFDIEGNDGGSKSHQLNGPDLKQLSAMIEATV